MAESQETKPDCLQSPQGETQQTVEILDKPEKSISFGIWPPSQRTRDAVTNRLIETLTNPSVLSKRYGSIPLEESSEIARLIEQDAFSIASGLLHETDDGIEILQSYSKEISKRMLDTVKSRSHKDSNEPHKDESES